MHIRLRKLLLTAGVAAVLLSIVSCATRVEDGPFGHPPMINGLMGTSEWDNANMIDAGWDDGAIWITSDSQYVYLCISSSDTVHTGLDLYIDNMGGAVFMLHVSSAHGQRFLSDTGWQEMFWGPADTWTSNLIQSIYQDGRNLWLAPEAFEFQIDRQLLPDDLFKIMVHLKRPQRWVPDGADTLSSDEWLLYQSDGVAEE